MTESIPHTDNKFGRRYRLRGRNDFIHVVRGKETARFRGSFCRLAVASSESPDSRFGISVSKKAGISVKRNRIKRVIREYLRANKNYWPGGRSVVISVDRPCPDEKLLLNEIEYFFQKIR